jgi:hypothetical protein
VLLRVRRKGNLWPGMVTLTYNPNLQSLKQEDQVFQASLSYIMRLSLCILLKGM